MSSRLEDLRHTIGSTLARGVFRLPAPLLARVAGRLPEVPGQVLDLKLGFLLRALAVLRLDVLEHLSPGEARARSGRSLRLLAGRRPAGVTTIERTMDGPGGPLQLRIYTPANVARPAPAILYLHGGGFVIGDLETHDAPCAYLAHESGCVVVSLAYRLAPEHPFPAAVDDALAGFRWLADHADALGLDPARLAVGGDSAGGNLSAVVSQVATREAWTVRPAFQLLLYPATDMRREHESHRAFGVGYMLSAATLTWFLGHYLRNDADILDPRASPLLAADLRGLPPAYVAVAGFDPLRDEGRAYAERMREAGVAVELDCHDALVHGYISLGDGIEAAGVALAAAARALRQALNRAPGA
jgi:acetyl esterase